MLLKNDFCAPWVAALRPEKTRVVRDGPCKAPRHTAPDSSDGLVVVDPRADAEGCPIHRLVQRPAFCLARKLLHLHLEVGDLLPELSHRSVRRLSDRLDGRGNFINSSSES